mmetsp:Transcript_43921/g.50539  ORF Transcript_43921/g.50539 Transcript_43921/m.50539 type:complete len:286 (-) Transcript_43921:82-939(-)
MASPSNQIPTSPAYKNFLGALYSMDHAKLDDEINKIAAGVNPGHNYELKSHLMRYDYNFNQQWLDDYSADYGARWAKGKERIELGMTAEDSYTHWANVMNFALKNGCVLIVLYRQKDSGEEWRFGCGSHCFDLADMLLPDYKELHPARYQPWADVFDKLFVDYLGGSFPHHQYYFNNSTCRVADLKLTASAFLGYMHAVIGVHAGYTVSHTIVISTRLMKIYNSHKKETHIVRKVNFQDLYNCKPDQEALLNTTAMNLRHDLADVVNLGKSRIAQIEAYLAKGRL